jgi:hypothetical protein
MMSRSTNSKDKQANLKAKDTICVDKISNNQTHIKSPKEFTHTFYPYGGTDIVKNIDHLIRLINTTGKTQGIVEKKTKYFLFTLDIDFKEKEFKKQKVDYPSDKEQKKIIKYIIKKIDGAFDHLIESDVDKSYIVCDKKKGNDAHIYYPGIIVDCEFGQAILEYTKDVIYNDLKAPIEGKIWQKILDPCTVKGNGLRIIKTYVRGSCYDINKKRSTYENIPKSFRKQVKILQLRKPKANNYNFDPAIDEDTDYVYRRYIPEVTKSESNKKVKLDKNGTSEELPISEKYFEELLDNLSLKRIDDREDWMRIIYLCRTYDKKKLAEKISSKSEKYDLDAKNTIIRIWNQGISNSQVRVGSLFKWSKEDNLEKHLKIVERNSRLTFKRSDEYLLYNYEDKFDIIEKSKYISDKAINKICKSKKKCIVLMAPTGVGKTTATSKIIKKNYKDLYKYTIISIISRRSMIPTHKNSFKKNGLGEFGSYTIKRSNRDKFIASLEYLGFVRKNYDVVILDEVNSLLKHFYSDTMDGKRIESFLVLLKLLKNCNLIIASDANVTSMVFSFLETLEMSIISYRNKKKNKKNIPLNIYNVRSKKTEDAKIFSIADELFKASKKEKSVLLLTDSQGVCKKIRNCLVDNGVDKDRVLLVTKDFGTLKELENCNEIWKGKIVLCSPKVTYGLDVLIKYDHVYLVYKGHTISSLEMIQQLGRSRNVKEVSVIFTEIDYDKRKNYHIDFEYNKEKEDKSLNYYVDEIGGINGKTACRLSSKLTKDGIIVNKESPFTNLHYYKSWFDRLFSRNKAQLFEKICKECGYKIEKHILKVKNTGKLYNNAIEIVDKYLEKEFDRIFDYMCKKEMFVDDSESDDTLDKSEFEDHEDTIGRLANCCFEIVKRRMNDLRLNVSDIVKYPDFRKIIANNDKFLKFKDSLILFEKGSRNDIKLVEKDMIGIKKLKFIEKLEKKLEIKERFDVNSLKCKDLDKMKKWLEDHIDELCLFWHGQRGVGVIRKRCMKKINKIERNDQLVKFISDLYNTYGSFICTSTREKKKDNKSIYVNICKTNIPKIYSLY